MSDMAEFNAWVHQLEAMRRRVICSPELEKPIREAVEDRGMTGFISVTPSSVLSRGRVFVWKLTEADTHKREDVDNSGAALS